MYIEINNGPTGVSFSDFQTAVSTVTAVSGAPTMIFYGLNPTSGLVDVCQAIFMKNKVVTVYIMCDFRDGSASAPPSQSVFTAAYPSSVDCYINGLAY